MKPIRSLVVTQNLEVATLWFEDPAFGHSVAVLPAIPLTQEIGLLWQTRFPSLQLLQNPEQALEWQPDVVVSTDYTAEPPGLHVVTDKFAQAGIPVANSSLFMDRLATDPMDSRNALLGLFSPNQYRRFIPLHSNPLMLQSEAIHYTLRYPEDSYILDLGDTRGSVVAVTAAELLRDIERFHALFETPQGFFSQRAGGLMSCTSAFPAMLFRITCLHSDGWVGRPVVSWTDGVNRVASWASLQDSELISNLAKLAGSWKARGPLTLECCMDRAGGVQVYRIAPGMESWLWTWLRACISSSQSWASLWKSMGKGVKFDYLEGNPSPSWCLETERDAPLLCNTNQAQSRWKGFERDTILGNTCWNYQDFDLTTLESLEAVCRTGLIQKKPLWAAAEQGQVEQYLASFIEVRECQEEVALPEDSGESQVPSIEEEEVQNVCHA
jgi:hypothetical protein